MKADEKRRADVLRMRLEGHTFEAIADALGYADRASAYNAYTTARRENVTEPLEELRELEADRLDALLAAVWKDALNGDARAVEHALKLVRARIDLYSLNSKPQPTKADQEFQRLYSFAPLGP